MNLIEVQQKIKEFNDKRNWSSQSSIKDLMLNMNEEIGELWNIIKWVDTDTQQKLIRENKKDVENFIGDALYLILKISYLTEVDSEKSILEVLEEYEKRFPIDKTKGKHANKLAGGVDEK